MRLFIGIALPKDVRNKIAADAEHLKHVIPGSYVPAANYHITLVFLGEIDQNGVEKAKNAMVKAAQEQNSVNLRLGRLGYFGEKDHAILHRTVDGWKQLQNLDHRLRNNLKEESVSIETTLKVSNESETDMETGTETAMNNNEA